MKIVQIRGGLGNQMFQYAFAVALQQKYPSQDVLIDIQPFKNAIVKRFRGDNFYHNGFEIEKVFPHARIQLANWKQIIKVSYYIPNYILFRFARRILPQRETEYLQTTKESYIYDRQALEDNNKYYFEGYWLSPKYFDFCKQSIWDVFEFPPFDTKENEVLKGKLLKDNSVSIHVRRGDFLNIPVLRDICTLDYYNKAIALAKRMVLNPVFFIFSSDQEWCKNNLKDTLGDSEVIFVANNFGNKSYRDMQLMSLARCNILANSSFSWWASYLNRREDHITIVPNKWVNLPCDDAYCKEWIKIN